MPPTIASARNAYSWPDIRLALLRLLPGREHRGALRLSVGDAAVLALRELLREHAFVGRLIGLHLDVRGGRRRRGGRSRGFGLWCGGSGGRCGRSSRRRRGRNG